MGIHKNIDNAYLTVNVKNQWSQFVSNHPHGNIFQTPEMYEVYKRTKYYKPVLVYLVNEKQELDGILLAVIQKEGAGLKGRLTARSIISRGPLVSDNDPKLLDKILKKYKNKIGKLAIYSQFRNLWDWGKLKNIFVKNGFVYEPHLDILIDLKRPKHEVFKSIHKGRKKNIRRAESAHLEFHEVKNLADFEKCYLLIKKNYKRIGLPCPDKSFFMNSVEFLIGENSLKTFSVNFDDEIIACRLVLCYNKTIYDWYAGTNSNYLAKYPNDFLPWKIMEWGIDNGFELFDFGGAGKPDIPYGVRDHKLNFGGDLVEFGRFELIHKRLLFFIGKKGFGIYKLLNGLRY